MTAVPIYLEGDIGWYLGGLAASRSVPIASKCRAVIPRTSKYDQPMEPKNEDVDQKVQVSH